MQLSIVRPASAGDEAPVWQTIKVGTFHSVIALREALENSKCAPANSINSAVKKPGGFVACKLGDSANEIIGKPEFGLSRPPSTLQLVVLSGKELGFQPDSQPSLRQIYQRAQGLGYALAPAEVGPQLRLQYGDQKVGEFLRIGMRPIKNYSGDLTAFSVGNGGAGLMLVGTTGDLDAPISAIEKFVFVQPPVALSTALARGPGR